MKFKTLFLQSVDGFLCDYRRNGFVVAGCNGPHNTPETALRNSCHWIIALARAFQLTGDENYKEVAEEIGATLLDKTFRPYGFSFYARECKGVDRCNGLIGQAWVIEALAELHALTANTIYRDLGIKLAKQHRFDNNFSVWHSLEIDGTVLNIDNVFNHQLWFAAAVALINHGPENIVPENFLPDEILNERIQCFMDSLNENLSLSESGLIKHHIQRLIQSPRIRFQGLWKHLRQGTLAKRLFKRAVTSKGADKEARDNGYHAFNTYAFSLLKSVYPNHSFWSSAKHQKLVAYLLDPKLVGALEVSIYGFPYNPPGFEIPYSLENLSGLTSEEILAESKPWLQRQISLTFNPETKMLDRNCVDQATQSARLYEAARFSDRFFEVLEVHVPAISGECDVQ